MSHVHAKSAAGRYRFDANTWLAAALLGPVAIVLLAIIVVPSIDLFVMSFTDASPGMDTEWVGWKNYVRILSNPDFQAALVRNVIFVVTVVGLEMLIGLGIALLLENPLPLRGLWMALIVAPYAVSPIVAVVMWKYMLDPNFGVVNFMMGSAGFPTVAWFTSAGTSMAGIIVIAVWKEFSFVTIVSFAALKAIPHDFVEAARIDGAGYPQILRFIKLPMILPALSIVMMFRIIYTLREFAIVHTTTGGGPGTSTEILALYLYKQAFRYLNFGAGAATGWLMLLATLLLAGFLVRRTYRGMFTERYR
ncbi:MAG: sugar ABC transporter permease [Alphaproteobacteria bacterium]|nr:sugar ABC transporter permease [Alphaproteobacteria bacterium]